MLEHGIRRGLNDAHERGQEVQHARLRRTVALRVLAQPTFQELEDLPAELVAGALEQDFDGIQEVDEGERSEERAQDIAAGLADGLHGLCGVADEQNLFQDAGEEGPDLCGHCVFL